MLDLNVVIDFMIDSDFNVIGNDFVIRKFCDCFVVKFYGFVEVVNNIKEFSFVKGIG